MFSFGILGFFWKFLEFVDLLEFWDILELGFLNRDSHISSCVLEHFRFAEFCHFFELSPWS